MRFFFRIILALAIALPAQATFAQIAGNNEYYLELPDGKRLELTAGSYSNGAKIEARAPSGRVSGRWKVESREDGFVRIVNAFSRKCLGISHLAPGFVQWTCDGGPRQLLRLEQKDNFITIIPKATGRPLSLRAAAVAPSDDVLNLKLTRAGSADYTAESDQMAAREQFLSLLKNQDYSGAATLAAAQVLSERDAWTGFISVARGGGVPPAHNSLYESLSDIKLLNFMARVYLTEAWQKEAVWAPRSRFKDIGMRFLSKALELYFRENPYSPPLTFAPPLRGRFNVSTGPTENRPWHGTLDGYYGYDLHRDDGETFGEPVFAAADGVVVETVDDNPDNSRDQHLVAGARANWVIIAHEGGVRSWYVHLKQRSILVHPGDRVTKGTQIGSAGNSGFTIGPHLHFQVERTEDGFSVPIQFNGIFAFDESSGRWSSTNNIDRSDRVYGDTSVLPRSGGRLFAHDDGTFEKTSDGSWLEKDSAGHLKFTFVELSRDASFILLRDPSRNVFLRFPPHGGRASYSTDNQKSWVRWALLFEK